MQNILGINTTDDASYNQYRTSMPAITNDFDSVLAAETTIYATPETSATQTNTSNSGQTSSVTVPVNLADIFKQAADQYGISESLLIAVAKTESNFNANATSSAGAMGVMQLMPSTASYLGVDNAYDAESNIMGGARYLSELLNKYNGDTALALAAYNAGPGNVDKYNGIPPFVETQSYVQKVMGYMNVPFDIANISVTAQPASDSNTTYVRATPDSQTADTTVATIYAVAASDVTNPAKLYI